MPCEIRRSGGRTVVLVGGLLFTFARLAAALPEDQVQSSRRVLASTDFALTGLAVKAEPSHQDIPRHIASLIATQLAGLEGSQDTPPPLNPNYRVRGELVGPSLRSPKVLESAIGAPLIIPPLALAGDHLVTNLRVVDTGVAGSPTVAEVIPDTCSISVIDQLLVSQVHVRELSYDEILASGIHVNQDSYSYYNFTLALATSSQAYEISIPIAMPKTPDVPPIAGPPRPGVQVGVKAPMPDVLPLLLEVEEPGGGGGGPELEGGTVRIPGLIVFPGRIALLHQFFEAIVIVGNGAPGGTPLVVHSLRARIELPQAPNPLDNPLRVAEVQVGGAVEELELHGLGADGMYGTGDDSSRFVPGESGQAAFLLEGLKEGLHTVKFKLQGTLDGLSAGPVTVRGEASGAVRVRDASFAVSFTHPSVVRAGQDYDLGITLFNSGSRDILGAYADLNPARIIGADPVDPEPDNRQAFPTTLKPGESGTVTWRLKARVTGAVTAAYTKVEGAGQTELQLVTGVGDRNVLLSPDSLILPDAVRYLPPPVVEASSAFLGQAWSIATAPSGSLPEGVLPVSRETVLSSAIELGVAGLRVRFGEPLQVSLVTLLRDWLGEGEEAPDAGFVEALCSTKTGFAWQDRVGEQLATALGSGTATAFHKAVAEGELARSRFLSALVTSTESTPFVGARLIDSHGQSVGLASPGARFGTVPVGAMLPLDWTSGGQARSRGAFLIASNPAEGAWTLDLSAWAAGVVDISIWLPIDEDLYRQVSFAGVSLAAGVTYRVRFNPYMSSTAVLEQCVSGSCSPTGLSAGVGLIDEPAPKLVGVLQVGPAVLEAGDRYGRMIALLFSKPVAQQKAEDAASYSIGGGILVGSNPPVTVGGPIGVLGAKLNFGNRFAFLKPSIPVGPFIQRTITLAGITDTRGLALSPPVSDEGIEMTVSPRGIPPGGYLTGRILNSDGTPIPSARIELFDWPCDSLAPVEIAEIRSDTSGHYVFDYIVNGECSPVMMVATHPTTASRKHFSAAVLYHGQHLALDFIFLARGAVEGVVTIAGQPVASAQVQVISISDPAAGQVVRSDSTGKYFAYDIPVGGVSVLGVGPEGQANATGFGAGWIDGPGKTATVNIALQSISGSVQGKVLDAGGKPVARSLAIAETRIPGIKDPVVLGFRYTAPDGAFQLANLPLGEITVFTTDSVTRTRVAQQIQLTSQVPSVTGVILMLPGYGSVSGKVIDQVGHYLAFAEVRCGLTVVSADPFGYYRLSMLSAGMQQMTATNPTTGLEGSAQVTVRAGQETTGVDIVVSAAATVRGTLSIVRTPGLPAVPLRGAKATYDGYHVVQTDAQGGYVLSNVPPGNYVLRFIDPTNRLAVNQTVRLVPGETLIRNLTFHPAALGGKIFQPDGQTPAVARVTVYALLPELSEGYAYGLLTGDHPITTISGSDGSYLIGNLNPSGFRIFAFNEFFPTPVGRIGTLPPDSVVTCNLTLVDTLAGKIKGRIFQPDAVTAVGEGIEVTLGGGHLADAMVRTDATGYYSFPEVFSTGTYNLTAIDPATGHNNRIRIAVERNKDCVADIRLLGRGSIQARVIDGAGAVVESGTVTVTGLDYPNASVQSELSVESGGLLLFEDLHEGPYSVTASQQGLSGRVSVVVTLSGLTTVTVQLQPSGTVTGRVLMADGVTWVGLADVRLIIGNRTVGFTVSSDEGEGSFEFPDVPVGDFKLEAYDNRSTRVGRTAGRVSQHGETVNADILLVAIGTVRGQVTANSSPVDHAYLTLRSGEFGFSDTTLKATTDASGNYSFPGIPTGKFTLSATHPASGLTGYGEGLLPGGAEPLPDKIVNIALEYSASLDGAVYDHQGTPVAGAQVTVTIGSRVFTTASREDGKFRLDYVPLGEATIGAEASSGYDRGVTGSVTLSQPGSTVSVEVTFEGVGAVKGDALDGDGVTGLVLGTVTLTNSEWSPAVVLASPVQAGKYELQGVPAGPFTMRLTVPNRMAVGVANGTLQAAETLTIPLVLEPAGTVTGKVVKPDGTTPAVGADVTVRVTRTGGGIVTIVAHTDAAGVYRADQVSLGTIEISVQHYETDGLAVISGLSLTANGQVLDVPLLILDENPIGVQSVSPTNGSLGVSRSTAVTVTFSEPAKASTVSSVSFRLLKGAINIGATLALSADGLVATLTPNAILPDNSTFTVVVTTQVTDLVGRKLPTEFRSTFTTPDETPPVVTSIDPAAGAVQVPAVKVIQVTFNEALDPQQAFAGVVRIFPDGHPEALVPLVMSLGESGTTITAQPAVPLAESTRYKAEVTSQKDLAGNIQPAVYTVAFSTVDNAAPTIDSVSVEGQLLFTKTPLIIIQYHDDFSGIDPTSLVLRLDGQDVSAGAWISTYETRYQVPNTAPLSTGGHNLEVRISDTVGNQSILKTAQFSIDNVPPQITTFTIAGQPVVDGMTVTVFRPIFTASYSDNHEVNPSTTKLLLGFEGQPLAEVPAVITASGLTYQPAADLPQGPYVVELVVRDLLGNSNSTGPIRVLVDVDAPMIAVLAPLFGSQHGGTVVGMEGERLLQPGGGPPVVTIGGNPANILSTQAGPPETVTIMTPPGAPGLALIRVQTERGVGTANVFVYEFDTRTPPALEDDTVLLWHLDEASGGAAAIADSGPIGIQGTASSTSTAVPGRFGLGRSGVVAASDQGFLSFGSSSFTLESWLISGPITRTYAVAGKTPSTWGGTYSLSVKPTGALWGHVRDSASHYWEAMTDPASVQLTDGQWHHVAMVVDREAGLLRLYIDGVERASSPAPAGFANVTSTTQFKVGDYDLSDPGTGPNEFPGIIDEVRISANARSAARIQEIALGRDGPLALEVTRIQPDRLIRGLTQDIRVSGYNLAGVTGELVDPSGEQSVVEILGSAATEARLRVQVPASGPLGEAELRLHSDRGDTVVSLLVFDPVRSTPGLEDDTALLIHFEDEPGQAKLKDSGPFSIDMGAAIPVNTNAYPGFAGRSRMANLGSDLDQGVLDMTEENFTAELWLNAEKGTNVRLSYMHTYETTWYVEITALGELKASIRDVNNQSVIVATWPVVFDPEKGRRVTRNLRDGQWHHLALVLDRQAALLSVYIDGSLGQTTAIPPTFGQLKKSGINSYLRLQCWSGTVLIDELRISSSAHGQEKIWQDFSGDHPVGISSIVPFDAHERRVLNRGIPVSITLNGFDLAGATAQIRRNGTPVDASVAVTGSSYGQLGLAIEIAPEVALGPADLVLLLPSGAEVNVPADIIESHGPRVESDTVLLWRLDEPGNGTLRVQDAVGAGSGGLTATSSSAVEGRFGLARRNPGINAYDDGGILAFASQSFTVEGWVKLPGDKADSVIFGRGTSGSGGGYYLDWGLSVLATGGLRAVFRNTANVTFTIDLEPLRNTPTGPRKMVIGDETWHHLALVLNREAGQAEIYIDGIQECTAAIPAGFGALRTQSGSAFRVGFFAGADPLLYGISDEARISLSAHSPAQIWQDFSGIGPVRVTAVSPLLVQRDRTQASTTEVIVEGDQLAGLTAQMTRSQSPVPGLSVEVTQSSDTQARLLIPTAAQVGLGPAELTLSAAGSTFNRMIQIVEPSGLPRAPDTALLWHMENPQNGTAVLADSGPFRLSATSASDSTSDDGRFGMGRRNAGIQLLAEDGPTDMGWSDFTLECWMKSGSIGRPYVVIGRQQNWLPSYGLTLFPSGVLRARAVDTAGINWEARISPIVDTGGVLSLKPLLDDKWHLVSMAVDRQSGLMKVYVDGLERASVPAPAGFGAIAARTYVYAGIQDTSESGHIDGPLNFPGVIDDVRFSSTMHDSAQLTAAFFGTDSPVVTEVLPKQLARGSLNSPVSLHGLGLAGATVHSDVPSVVLQTVGTGPSQADLSVSLPNDLLPGLLPLVAKDPAGRSGSAQLMVTAPQAFTNPTLDDGDTLVLWHLDDDRPGQVTLAGSGDAIPDALSASSAAASLPVTDGRFGYGRKRANLMASAGFGSFEPATSGFTVECWVRTDPVDRTYSLVGRSDAEGSNPEFGIALLRSGVLRAFVYDSVNRMWTADTTFHAYDSVARIWKTCIVTDGQWHLVSMVVDRTAGELRLYVDGELEAATAPPADFGTLRNNGKRFRAGYRNQAHSVSGDAWGLAEFPGDVDEIRVLAATRTAEQIRTDFGLLAHSTAVLGPAPIARDSVGGSAYSGHAGSSRLTPQPFSNSDEKPGETILLWHLDERTNGSIKIVGSGDAVPTVIGGQASDASIAEAGRFAGGRTNAGIVADPDLGALDFGASSFTVEFWLRTDPVFSTYTLVGRDGPPGEARDFGISLLPSGRLRAWLYDRSGTEWAVTPELRVDDSVWRLVTLSIDREAGWLYLMIDEVVVAAAACPAGFGALANQGQPLRAGHIDIRGPATFGGPTEFPGVLDEVRILNFARKPAEEK